MAREQRQRRRKGDVATNEGPQVEPGDVPLVFTPVVVVDTREQLAYDFHGLRANAKEQRRPLLITTEVVTLAQGDYSLKGFEHRVAVERKSLADAFQSIGKERERFVRELERLNALEVAAVVIEADWDQIFREPPSHTTLSPKVVFRSLVAWTQRYPRVHWWMMPSRSLGMAATFRILERFWLDEVERRAAAAAATTEGGN